LGSALLLLCVITQAWQWIAYLDFKFSLSCILFGLAAVAIVSSIKCNITVIAFFGAYSYEIYLFEGVFLRYNFTENPVVNSIAFVLFTTSVAYSFKRIHEYATRQYMDLIAKF